MHLCPLPSFYLPFPSFSLFLFFILTGSAASCGHADALFPVSLKADRYSGYRYDSRTWSSR
jgi:hypothetical protein